MASKCSKNKTNRLPIKIQLTKEDLINDDEISPDNQVPDKKIVSSQRAQQFSVYYINLISIN